MKFYIKIFDLTVLIGVILSSLFPILETQTAFGHSIDNPSKQRIGNYEMEMATLPSLPVSGNPAEILLRIFTINGQELVDTQISILIEKDGRLIEKSGPVVVPLGHYTYGFTFSDEGQHILNIDLEDFTFSGNTIRFTFPVNVVSPLTSALVAWSIPITGAIIAAVVGIIVLKITRKKSKDGKA